MRNIKFLIPTLLLLVSCGLDPNALARQSINNQSSVDDLAMLLRAHPEIGNASLYQINESSRAGNEAHRDLNFALPIDTNTNLDPGAAKKAQELLDKILSEYAFEAQFSANIKIMGIGINANQERMKVMRERAKEFEGMKGPDGPSKFDTDFPDKEISCEEIVNNPFIKFPKAESDRINEINKKRIKEALSKCSSLSAQKFLQCTSDFNRMMVIINEFANCDMKDFKELETKINQNIDGQFLEIIQSVSSCMEEDFAHCNFKPEKNQPTNNG